MSDFGIISQRMLGNVPSEQDKRPSSPIYNTLMPVAAELVEVDISIEIFREQMSLLEAVGANLDNWAANFAITRNAATRAIRIAEMIDTDGIPINLPIGSRFATPNVEGGVNFTLIENLGNATSLLECETAGTIGNEFIGALLPLFVINNLGGATMIGTQVPAENEESDDALRARILFRLRRNPFGGNMDAYREFTTAIDGVGAVKIFPLWDGGGTVKLSIVDGEMNPATPEFVDLVQELIDPIPNNGIGLGVAPIGHRISVVAPNTIDIDVSATISPQAGYTIPQLQAGIEAAIESYITELRAAWANADSLLVYIARINAAIIGVEGVNNVMNIAVNGASSDFEILQTAKLQQLPIMGDVMLF